MTSNRMKRSLAARKPMPPKGRDLTIAGVVMAVTSICWLVLPAATVAAGSFAVVGLGMITHALLLWRDAER